MSTDSPQTFGSKESKAIPNIILQERPPVTPDIPREEKAQSQLHKLPKPTGYRILVVPYSYPKSSKGGILLADSTLKTEELAATVAYVIALGPDAYADPNKFPEGAWCKPGDYVLFGRYAGARIVMQGEDNDDLPLRLLNDDEVLAVIDNPEDYVGIK
jgi:co-chaperonin GroES (HSP10)